MVLLIAKEYSNFASLTNSQNIKSENSVSEFYKYLKNRDCFPSLTHCLEDKVVSLINEKYGEISRYNVTKYIP